VGFGLPHRNRGTTTLSTGPEEATPWRASFEWGDIVLMQQPVRTLLQGDPAERAQEEWRRITEVEKSVAILHEMLDPLMVGSAAAEIAEWALRGSDDDLLSIPCPWLPSLYARLGELRTVIKERSTQDTVIHRQFSRIKEVDSVVLISMFTAERLDATSSESGDDPEDGDYEEGAWNYQSGSWELAEGLWQRGELHTLWQPNQLISARPGTKVVVS
jgi:hypothetical protein